MTITSYRESRREDSAENSYDSDAAERRMRADNRNAWKTFGRQDSAEGDAVLSSLADEAANLIADLLKKRLPSLGIDASRPMVGKIARLIVAQEGERS